MKTFRKAQAATSLPQIFAFLELSGANSILGRAVIVQEGKDDLTSQPSGNAGARLAWGVIEKHPK
jgi:Cu/Zn superoxide dismutase